MILAALLLCLIGAGCEQAVATDRIVVTHIEGVAKDAIGRLTPQPKIPDALPAPHPKPSVTDWLAEITPDVDLSAFEAAPHNELWHEARIAMAWRKAGLNVETEVHTADNARCDLVTDDVAWELDWAKKWAECGGQATFYAKELNRKPGMVLLAESGDERFVERAKVVAKSIKAELIVVPVEGDVPLPAVKVSAAVEDEGPIVGYDFWADWCVPCRDTTPIIEEFKTGGLRIEAIDADDPANRALMVKYRVGALPTFIRLTPDGSYQKLVGRQSRDSLARFYGFTPPQSDPPASAAVSSALTATPRVYACGYRGSGTVIDRGCLLTCAHVVIDELTGEYRSPIRLMFGEKLVPAKVVGHVFMDSGEDLALLEFDAETQVIEVADSVADLNAAVTSHGYPRGEPQILERRLNLWNARRGANGQPEYAMGAYRFASQQFIGGESGGGVTDASGKLVGVISAKDGRNGIVVSLDAIKTFLGEMK